MIREFAGADIVYLIEAARWTVLLALVAMIGGGLLGIVVAVLRVIPLAPLNWLAIAWINSSRERRCLANFSSSSSACR